MRIQVGPFDLQLGRKGSGMDMVTEIPWTGGNGWWPVVRESFAGAWQRNYTPRLEDALAHPTFWSCVTLIMGDIAKLRPMLMQEDADGVGTEVENAAYTPVLRKPNHYQDRIQFISSWLASKLCRGNTYILKERDLRGVVVGTYPLDPTRVRPLVSPTGDVYYALGMDTLSGVGTDAVTVPAREIIHDRWNCLYHPLVGLSPVFACGHAALVGQKMMRNTEVAAENGSMIGGLLVAPGKISADTASKLEEHWNANYVGGANAGKVAVIGDGLKFEKPNVMSAVDAQIIDQLKWGDEKICATLHVPAYMVGVGPLPSFNNVEALTQVYYGQCLQILVEALELCWTEGVIGEAGGYSVEMDLEGLDRFDSLAKTERLTKGVAGGLLRPNEGRRALGRRAVPGGDRVYMQQQNWPIDANAKVADNATKTPPKPQALPPAAAPAPALPAKGLNPDALLGAVVRQLQEAAS
jgi:HK97 family phage portal protein